MAAELYKIVYLVVVIILTIAMSVSYSGKDNKALLDGTHQKTNTPGYVIAVILTMFIGLRPLSGRYFVDMVNYNELYYALSFGRQFHFSWDKQNYLFDNIFDWLGANHYDITIFFLVIAAIYFIMTYKAISRLFPGNALYAYIIFLGAFSTFSYATNGIKAGAAAALFLCAIAYRDRKWIAALFLFATLGFHHSMVVPIAAFIAALFCKNSKFYLVFWVLCMMMAAAHVTYFQALFADLSNDQSAVSYLTNINQNWGGKTGFRWDFILYSALPIAVGYYAIIKRNVKSVMYSFILNVYLFTNAIWMLCMYIPFNNRIAYLSWCIYPVVLVYPFFHCCIQPRQVVMLNSAVWVQLLFTIVMSFV